MDFVNLYIDIFFFCFLISCILFVVLRENPIMDMTKKQFFIGLCISIPPAILFSTGGYYYQTSRIFNNLLYNRIISMCLLALAAFGFIYALYASIVGTRNLRKNYHIYFYGKWLSNRKIKELKELYKKDQLKNK